MEELIYLQWVTANRFPFSEELTELEQGGSFVELPRRKLTRVSDYKLREFIPKASPRMF